MHTFQQQKIYQILQTKSPLDSEVNVFNRLEYLHKLTEDQDNRITNWIDSANFVKFREYKKGIKSRGHHIVPCREIFVGISKEHGINTQNRLEQIIWSNVQKISESIDDIGYEFSSYPIVVKTIRDLTNGESDTITINGIEYKYILISGHHRFYAMVEKYVEVPVLIGGWENEDEENLFASILSNDKSPIDDLEPYSFDTAKNHILRLQEKGSLGKEFDDVEKYARKYFKTLKNVENCSYASLTSKLCRDLGVAIPQHIYTKESLMDELAICKKNGTIIDYSKNGNLDSNGERGYSILMDHTDYYRVFVVEYLAALAEGKEDTYVHNLWCGLQRIHNGKYKNDLPTFKKLQQQKIYDLLDKVATGVKLFSEGKGGRIKFNWVATIAGNEEQGRIYS
jgi:hypothetical protein